jgi:hypothetical protein
MYPTGLASIEGRLDYSTDTSLRLTPSPESQPGVQMVPFYIVVEVPSSIYNSPESYKLSGQTLLDKYGGAWGKGRFVSNGPIDIISPTRKLTPGNMYVLLGYTSNNSIRRLDTGMANVSPYVHMGGLVAGPSLGYILPEPKAPYIIPEDVGRSYSGKSGTPENGLPRTPQPHHPR